MRKPNHLVLLLCLLHLSQLTNAALSMEEKLTKLRDLMKEKGYVAAIIVSEDEHQSEYVAKYDMRREWISDFTGSAGQVIITMDEAALWTDSRYELAASQQLDSRYWKLMKPTDPTTPSMEKWLKDKFKNGGKVFQNSKFTSISRWMSREASLKEANIVLDSQLDDSFTPIDIIDEIWPEDEREKRPNGSLSIHELKFAGRTVKTKLDQVVDHIKFAGADLFVVTALDDVAWLFNLRGTDLPANPMFYAYAIVNARDNSFSLYTNLERITEPIREHLSGIFIHEYTKIFNDIKTFSDNNYRIWLSPQSSYAILNSVSKRNNLVNDRISPVAILKSVKDDTELKNIRQCQIRDSAARVRHMHWLEIEMKKGTKITEKTAADKLIEFQAKDDYFHGVSFGSISAVGKNAAIVHYSTDEGEDAQLTRDKIYLLDAGAQYEDCTTDITRTHHYGTPTEFEKFAYTKVLQGSTDLANLVFPPGVYGSTIDAVARAPLWEAGLTYGHGTGHGIGYYLSVHEAPPYNSRAYDESYVPGMIQSDEPGYYEDGSFGIRLETDLEVVEANTMYNFKGRKYMKFDSLSLVPFDTNLIDECMLTSSQVDWLNNYNKLTREKVGPVLEKINEDDYKYLLAKTEPFKYSHEIEKCLRDRNGVGFNKYSSTTMLLLVAAAFVIKRIM